MKIRFRAAPRSMAVVAALSLVLSVTACGGSTSSPTPVNTGPSRATITATFSNAVWGLSPRVGFNYRLAFDLTIRESAGLSAKLNFLRADFRDGNGNNIERQEAGSNVLSTLAASGTLTDRILVDFNDGRASSALITINFTDAKGNVLEVQVTITCC